MTLVVYAIYTLFLIRILFGHKSWISQFMLVLFAYIVALCCNTGADCLAIYNRFQLNNFSGLPKAFQLYASLFRGNYYLFKAVSLVFILTIILTLYKKNSEHFGVLLLLFLIYPFTSYIGQTRNGISSSIVIFALIYFIKNEKNSALIIYVILIGVASLIHPSSAFYIVMVLIKLPVQRRKFFGFLMVFSVLAFFVLYFGIVYSLVELFIADNRVLQYLKMETLINPFGTFITIIGQIVWIIYISVVGNNMRSAMKSCSNDFPFSQKQLERVLRMNGLFIAFLPFYFISHMFFRLYKYVLIVNFYVIVKYSFLNGKLRIRRILIGLILVMLSFVFQCIVDNGIYETFIVFDGFSLSAISELWR